MKYYSMKKYLLLISAVAVLVLSGCTTPSATVQQEIPEPENTEQTETTLLSNTDPSMIKKAITDYLTTADLKGKGDVVVKTGDKVSVHYIGRLSDSEVFDTSIESIAKVSGKYSPARNYNEGLWFTVGAGQMIAGFDRGVQGMKIGQTKTITIPAKDAYWEWSESYLISVPRSQLPEGEYKKWLQLMSANGQTFMVYDIKDDVVVLDGNHELAGKDLIFDITILSIN